MSVAAQAHFNDTCALLKQMGGYVQVLLLLLLTHSLIARAVRCSSQS
jgi:hypothetical protein